MTILLFAAGLSLSLIVGSFLNVIIYRMPLMLQREWHLQSCDFLGQTTDHPPEKLSLALPRSHCPHCKQTLAWWHNLPLLSFLLLKGRCHYCQTAIAWRYPLIELLSVMIALVIYWRFGVTSQAAAALVFSWGLLAISAIDIAQKIIPDSLTYCLLWIGLACNAFAVFTTPQSAIWGAMIGYLFFWCIAKSFLWLRKKEGLGYGDFKLCAMLAAWLGIYALPQIMLIAAVSGLVIGGGWLLTRKRSIQTQIPFGPFLALGGWCTMLACLQ